MSSPFQRAFSGKSPLNEITISQKELNNPKSASSQPAAKLENTEGQGGYDYEKPKGEMNFPGDDGYDTLENSMDKPKKKTESVAQMRSPLNGSYESGGRGEIYVSSVGAIQQAVSSVQNAVDSYMNEDPQHKADRIAGRIDSRKNRLYHGEDIMNDDSLTDEEKENKLAEVNQRSYSMKTQELIDRAATSQKEADEFELSEIERLKKENEAYKKKFNI